MRGKSKTMAQIDFNRDLLVLAHLELGRMVELLKAMQKHGEWDDWIEHVASVRRQIGVDLRKHNRALAYNKDEELSNAV